MRLGLRLLFAFFLINGIAAFFVLRVFMAEIKPSVREVDPAREYISTHRGMGYCLDI